MKGYSRSLHSKDADQNVAAPLIVESVTKQFQQGDTVVEALRDFSLTVERGQYVAVMGASGSGKSTLLHVIAGLTRPSKGRVLVDGQDLSAMSDRNLTLFRRRRIGLVFQAFNLIPTLSAEDNVLLPLLAEGGVRNADDRIQPLMTRLAIASRMHHLPDALSGGEQQRVAIARAIAGDPSIILADEPTGSLDSVTGQSICRLLRELCDEQGRTIMVVTHEPSVAVWAERIVVLKDGRLLTDFPTSDFRDAHSLAAHYQDIVGEAQAGEVHI
jgi:putative ABC transport system ATP-binding protein